MTQNIETEALVIGTGPAGLMAADALSAAGRSVLLADAMPSPGRKLLMAGKSGLNLTMDTTPEAFLAAYTEGQNWLAPILNGFDPDQVKVWAKGLGVETFTGSSGRVFPTGMKASPLLRAWLARLGAQGADLRRRWRWQGWSDGAARFATPQGEVRVTAGATVLALGGASWSRLGSDGAWAEILDAEGVDRAPFRPSNCGFLVNWSGHMARHAGAAVKPVRLSAGGCTLQAEFVVTRDGIQGGGIYALAHLLRDGAGLHLDLLPGLSSEQAADRLARPRGKASLSNHMRKTLRLSPVRIALLHECTPTALPREPQAIAAALKDLVLPLTGPAPLDGAISTAGGVRHDALDENLMLHVRPGVYCAGEMLDWDAPTGGYLLTGCLATGLHAGRAAAESLSGPG